MLVAPRPEKSIDGSKVHDGTSTTDNFAVAGPTYDTAAVAPSATAVRRAEVGNLTRKSCSLSHLRVNIFGLLGKKKNMVRRRMQPLLVSHLHIYLRKNIDSHTSPQVLLCQVLAFFGNCTLPLIECYTCRDFFGTCTLPFASATPAAISSGTAPYQLSSVTPAVHSSENVPATSGKLEASSRIPYQITSCLYFPAGY